MASSDREQDGFRFPRGDERPERARDFEAQIAPRALELLADGVLFRLCGALERVDAAGRVDRPAKIQPGAEVVGDVGIDDL